MRIVSYNVNGLRARLSSPQRTLSAFLDLLDADIICLQETKMARNELTADVAVAEGYESFFSCTRTVKKGRIGYSGVATFCRVGIVPSSTSPILPLAADEGFTGLLHRTQTGDIPGGKGRVGCYEEVAQTELSMQELLQLDSEGRCLVTDHGSFVLFNLYCPRVECGDMDRLEFKLNFFHTLQRRWEALLKQNRRIIAVGDFNISPYPIDSCCPGANFDKNICRKWLRSLLRDEGGPFVDVFRFIHRERKEAYTCWPQLTGAEEFNFGTRIDLVLAAGHCNHEMIPQSSVDDTNHAFVECEVQDSDILSQFRRVKPDTHPRWQGGRSLKLEGSDHAPIIVCLKEQSPVEPHEVPPLAARFMPEIRGRQQNLVALMKRQPSPMDTEGTESKIELSRLEFSMECSDMAASTPKSVTSLGRWLERGPSIPSFNVKRMSQSSPISVVGKGKKMQGLSTSAFNMKKQGVRSVQKSDVQQKDLRAFFLSSSSQTKSSLANEDIRLPNLKVYSNATQGLSIAGVDSGSQQSFVENVDVVDITESRNELNLTVEDFEGPTPDQDVLGSQGSYQVRSRIINDREEHCDSQSQMESDCSRFGEIDLEHLIQSEQIRAAEGTRIANAAWTRIREKMARAVPLCQGHDEPCVARVVKKPGPNIGRGFYVCARAEGPQSNPEARCDHFEWASSFKKGGKPLSERTDAEQPRTFLKRIS